MAALLPKTMPNRCTLQCLMIAAVLTTFPITACQGQPVGGPILRLAEAWSGDPSPACVRTSTHGELIDGQVDPWRCHWRLNGTSSADSLWGMIDDPSRASMVMWQRQPPTHAEAKQFIDSLSTRFTALGLVARTCRTGSVPAGAMREMRWRSDTLTAYLMFIVSDAGPPKVVVFAVDKREQIPPPFACD